VAPVRGCPAGSLVLAVPAEAGQARRPTGAHRPGRYALLLRDCQERGWPTFLRPAPQPPAAVMILIAGGLREWHVRGGPLDYPPRELGRDGKRVIFGAAGRGGARPGSPVHDSGPRVPGPPGRCGALPVRAPHGVRFSTSAPRREQPAPCPGRRAARWLRAQWQSSLLAGAGPSAAPPRGRGLGRRLLRRTRRRDLGRARRR
jgi:hypothetical protein